MCTKDPKLIVLLFNECINNQDITGLTNLMTENHLFIDSSKDKYQGKELMTEGWKDFFNQYPDYHNYFSIIESRENLVIIIGHSTCSYEPLDGPALWTAKVENDLVSEWHVYLDTQDNRDILGLNY
jgi:ketosteroid isomerase-like protein